VSLQLEGLISGTYFLNLSEQADILLGNRNKTIKEEAPASSALLKPQSKIVVSSRFCSSSPQGNITMGVYSAFKGTFIKEAEYGPSGGGQFLISNAQVLTPNGPIDVELDQPWHPKIKIGDLVECDSGTGVFHNGRLLTYADTDIVINGIDYMAPK